MQHDWPATSANSRTASPGPDLRRRQHPAAEHIVLGQPAASPGAEKPSPQPAFPLPPSLPETESRTRAKPRFPPALTTGQSEAQSRKSRPPAVSAPPDLNPRQIKAWPAILKSGGTNRAQYQEAVGEEISVRTAQYDLQDLVLKGLLKKAGKGPSSRYVLTSRLG
jgi:hypothetical protein